jgi:lysozyme family protein
MHIRENYGDFLSGDFNTHLHNGQVLGRPTTIVPTGVHFPQGQFYEAAVDALTSDEYREGVQARYQLSADSRDVIAMISWAEVFNGQGHFSAGRPSPYVFNGTNLHDQGTFTADGVFDPSADDVRPGVYLIIRALMELE